MVGLGGRNQNGGMRVQDMEAIYRNHANMVYKFLLSKTRDADYAEELTQEVFYRAIQSVERYDGTCKVTTWLCAIARHVWLQDLNKRKRRRQESLSNDLAASENVEEQVLESGQRTEIFRQLHQLAEPMREVMYLRLSGELSFRDIGEILDKDETWARVTFYRGKQKLAKGVSL